MKKVMKKRVQYLVNGILIGGSIGAALSFLFAPKSGRELRSDIGTGLNSSLDKLKNTGTDVASKVKQTASNTVDKFQAAVNAGITTYKREGDKVKTSKEILEETLQDVEKK